MIGACVYVETDGSGKCTKARVGFGGLASGPKRSPAAEAGLVGCGPGDADGIAQAMAAAAEELETQGDLWADPAYRSNLIRTLGTEMAATALRRAAGRPEAPPLEESALVSTRTVRITINGEVFEETVPIRMLLTDFIRDRAGLTGTHVGCTYEGVCGACTVQLDGEAVKSCLMLAVQADGHAVTTVEGLAETAS